MEGLPDDFLDILCAGFSCKFGTRRRIFNLELHCFGIESTVLTGFDFQKPSEKQQFKFKLVKVKLFQFRLQALRPYCLKARSNLLMASGKGLGLEDLKITYSFDSFPFLVAATCAS